MTGSSPPADLVWSVNGEKVAAMEVHQESFSHFEESRGHSAVRQMVRSLTSHMCTTLVHLFLGLTRCLWEYKGRLLLYLYGLYFSIFFFLLKFPQIWHEKTELSPLDTAASNLQLTVREHHLEQGVKLRCTAAIGMENLQESQILTFTCRGSLLARDQGGR